MSTPYALYGSARSRSSRIAWTLEELGVAWTWHPISFQRGQHRSADFLAMNPGGKVPVLMCDTTAITESAAIARFLCARHPEGALLPPEGTLAAARVDQWLFFTTTELEQALWTRAKHTFALPEKLRVPAVRDTAAAEFQRAVAVADTLFGSGPYAAGDHFTIADIFLAHTLIWARAAGQWEQVPPRLQAYTATQLGRAAYRRATDRETGS